ncbi:MAG: hypothetical protein UY48_C0002G0052 [Candidatus Gottesmanbacteria bacterium GW2011_GWB1_49_7]|uniref:Uncharacterized protein n=1 Tax=Candidatus Gottesmanbacteria bacterium GW2011_GWB1_49_7 TaxID=1618448 RepID=A0A0G1W3L5_9BACT|nr:MAG: hypothetical protein UY48_C0002G0052 [Candidatus Gottesmanbacteria bacterium GW2011_GWB1_49_7]
MDWQGLDEGFVGFGEIEDGMPGGEIRKLKWEAAFLRAEAAAEEAEETANKAALENLTSVATQALAGLLANPHPAIVELSLEDKAEAAVNAAEALLSALGRGKSTTPG